MACWVFATQKDGVSALSLKRSLDIGSYQTAWALLHRLRSVLVRPGCERLSGVVEVDETYIGGEEPARDAVKSLIEAGSDGVLNEARRLHAGLHRAKGVQEVRELGDLLQTTSN